MTQVTLAEKIRYLRKARGLSQVELARRLGLRNNSFVSHLERGSKRPSPDLLRRIAKLFSYDFDNLMALSGAPGNRGPAAPHPELQPVPGADLRARLRREIEVFDERVHEVVGDALPDFLWDREHRLLVEERAHEVWVICPRIAHHGMAADLLQVATANLRRGVPYRYLLPDSKEMRVEAGRLLKRYQGLPEDEARIDVGFARRERFPFLLEVTLFDPRDPARAQGVLTPAGGAGWEVALGNGPSLELAAHIERIWEQVLEPV